MAISFVGGATATSQGNADVSVSLTALTGGSDTSPTAGDLIIFAYNIADVDNVDLNLACNTVGFTEVADLFGNGTQDANLGVYWKLHDTDTAVVGEGSLGGTDTSIQGAVMVFRGVDQSSPLDVTTTTATGTTTGDPDPPSIDWVTAGTWTVIVGSCAHAANVNGTFTGPTNYTTDFRTIGNQDTADGIIGMGYNSAPADPENPGLITTATTASGWCAATLALRPALNVTVTPDPVALITSLFAPTVTASDHKTVTPGVVSLITATFAPTVTASDHKTVVPGVASLTTSLFAPIINIGVNVVPSTASLITSLFVPIVTATDHKTVVPGTAALSIAAFAPTVSTPRLVTPSTASLTTSLFAPTINVGTNVVPSTASLTVSLFAPTISITDNRLVTPDTLALALSSFAPVVALSDHKVVTPGTDSLILTTYAPRVLKDADDTGALTGTYTVVMGVSSALAGPTGELLPV